MGTSKRRKSSTSAIANDPSADHRFRLKDG
jgi:hypothetical protein